MKILSILLLFLLSTNVFGQNENFRFKKLLVENPTKEIPVAVVNTRGNLSFILNSKEILTKKVTKNWIYIQASPIWLNENQNKGFISSFHFEFGTGTPLNDSTIVRQHIAEVHAGTNGLSQAYTGENVIMAYVDQGIDFNHEDFRDASGQTRVIYYWDQGAPIGPNTPVEYGYGIVWNQTEMQNGTCTSTEESTAHGTTVAGAGSSDGSATGREKGVCPDSKIIAIETDFTKPNWTLTVADACDFVFKKADELGLPAVVNLSLGSYLGSHDGDDPAADLMESLLDEKSGRMIVCAAGNSGNWGKYHVRGNVDADTNFVWTIPNPSSQLGANTVYMDLWTDTADADWRYAVAANLPNGTFDERAETEYRVSDFGIGTEVKDTLWNNGNRIAIVSFYPEIVGASLHIEILFSTVDSTNYLYAFKTTGSGNYDAWTGSLSLSLNNMLTITPSSLVYPNIIHYSHPDAEKTIVSSWACSEKIITVGNTHNRLSHLNGDGVLYTSTGINGNLSINSSKGPTRRNVLKPETCASGDVTLSACPSWLTAPTYSGALSNDLKHARNGGTSMASPVVAGIAGLYLQKCSKGNYVQFKELLVATSTQDALTGAVPNNGYGNGKIHALNLMLATEFIAQTNVTATMCSNDSLIATSVPLTTIDSVIWNSSIIGNPIALPGTGNYSCEMFSNYGCKASSTTLAVNTISTAPMIPIITASGGNLSTSPYPNLAWYENGIAISGATTNTLTIALPNSNNYSVVATAANGCESVSQAYNPSAGLNENSISYFVFPNPTEGIFTIQSTVLISSWELKDVRGRIIKESKEGELTIDISLLSTGNYFLKVNSEKGTLITKICKI